MMGMGFVTVAALQRLQVPDSVAGFYTVSLLIGQTTASLAAGWLADRFGHKLPLILAGGSAVIAFGLTWLSPSANWYYLIFGCLGFSVGATIVSGGTHCP